MDRVKEIIEISKMLILSAKADYAAKVHVPGQAENFRAIEDLMAEIHDFAKSDDDIFINICFLNWVR